MLTLTRRIGERIVIGDDVEVEVLSVQGGRVRLGIRAPRSLTVVRGELLDRVLGQNLEASTEAQGPMSWRPPADMPVVELPLGLYGMPQLTRWVVCELAEAIEGSRIPLRLMVAVDRPAIRLLVVDLTTLPEYPIANACAAAGVSLESAAVAGVVTAPAEGDCTVNLAAPIVVDLDTRQGRQVILTDARLSVAAPLAGGEIAAAEARP